MGFSEDFWSLYDEDRKKKKNRESATFTVQTTSKESELDDFSNEFWGLYDEGQKKLKDNDIAPVKGGGGGRSGKFGVTDDMSEEEKRKVELRANIGELKDELGYNDSFGKQLLSFNWLTDIVDGITGTDSERTANKKQLAEWEAELAKLNGKEEKKKSTWFKGGAFEDGWQAGDLLKTAGATIADTAIGLGQGAGNTLEGITDLILHGVSKGADWVGADSVSDYLEKSANSNSVNNLADSIRNGFIEENTIYGDKGHGIPEAIGQILGLGKVSKTLQAFGWGAKAISAAVTTSMGASSMGSGISEAHNSDNQYEELAKQSLGMLKEQLSNGEITQEEYDEEKKKIDDFLKSNTVSDKDAWSYGAMKGVIDAGSELIFGGLGKSVNALGFNRGLSSLDDAFAKKLSNGLSKHIANKYAKRIVANGTEYIVKAGAEGLEEVMAAHSTALAKKLTYMSDEDLQKLVKDENALEQFLVSFVASAAMQGGGLVSSVKNDTDFVTGFTDNEQAVVNKEVERRIAEEEKRTGKKLSNKAKNEIQEAVEKDLDKGYISIDTIEEVLGGDSYKSYQDTVKNEDALKSEFDELKKVKTNDATLEQNDRYNELKKKLDELETTSERDFLQRKYKNEAYEIAKGDRLIESYNERARRGEAFTADLSKYDEKQRTVIQKAVDSGILNNTNRTHEFVDMVAKISADKGVLFDFTNNEKLKNSGFAVDGKTVNGYVTKDGITVNIQSNKSLNSVVGHEIAHVLEGTELYTELQKAITEYAKSKGDYQGRFDTLSKLYENIEGADVNNELTADLVGDYLFTDADFISNLSVKHRNVFQKIYDEIKYLCKVATAGTKEARELEKVKRAFEKAYREDIESETDEEAYDDVQYSVSVEDKATLDSLNEQVSRGEYDPVKNPDGGYYVTYKSMSFWGYDEDGNAILRSPMAEYVDGELSNAYLMPKDKSKLNWYQATETIDEKTGLPTGLMVKTKKPGNKSFSYVPAAENQDLIDGDWSNLYFNLKKKVLKNGKWKDSDVPARYNPYEHSSNSMLNDQFSSAYLRDNLVTVKMYVPVSEDGGAYRAQWSKDATGWADWKTGTVAGKINKQKDLQRRVYLSRYAAPVEIVPDSEVAQAYKGYLEGTDVSIPDNVVPPNLLNELKKAGVPITESGKVKYSLSTDSDGRQLSKEQQDYFKDSKMRDDNGNLKVMYHGTTRGGFHTFDQGYSDDTTSFFFVDRNDVAESYSGTSETYEAKNFRTAEDFNKFFAEIGADEYSVKEEDHNGYKWFVLYEDGTEIASSETAKMLYDEFRDWSGLGEGEVNYKVYLNLKNPLEVDAAGMEWDRLPSFKEDSDQYEYIKVLEVGNGTVKVEYSMKGDPAPVVEDVDLFEKFNDSLARMLTDMAPGESLEGMYANPTTTREYAQYAKEKGYDGVIFKNIVDVGGYGGSYDPATVAIAFESEQVKSVGNDAPTSDPDIRYSLSDSQGRELTKEQSEFFKDSKIKDENGNLLVVYHGSKNSGFNVFQYDKNIQTGTDYGEAYYFTSDRQKANGYSYDVTKDERVAQYKKDREALKNRFLETHSEADKDAFLNYRYEGKTLGELIDDEAYLTEGGEVKEVYLNLKNPLIADAGGKFYYEVYPEYFDKARKNGNDGIVIKNVIDNPRGKQRPIDTYIAFSPEQIKRVDNKNPTSNPDIRYSLSEDSEGRELSEAVKDRFGKSKVVDESGNLKVVYHGTASGEFTIFDKSKGSVEGDFGSGFYFTDNEADVSEHYEGGGPDFDNKVARRAEQIEAEEDIDYDEAEERARAELFKGGHKFEVYLNIENPAIVGETRLFESDSYLEEYNEEDYDDYDDYIADVEQLVADDVEKIIWDVERNTGAYSTDGLAEIFYNAYYEGGIGIEELKSQINDLYLEDDNGNFIGNEVARQVIESLGYDGIIDPTVSGKWNMDIEEGTTHYIVFKPNQIKAVTNQNPTDNPDINRSLSAEGTAPREYGRYNVYGKDIAYEGATEDVAPIRDDIAPGREVASAESEILPDDYAPMTEEDAAMIENEALDSITDADAPPEIDAPYDVQRDTGTIEDKPLKRISEKASEYLGLNRNERATFEGIVQNYSKNESLDRDYLYSQIRDNFSVREDVIENEDVRQMKKDIKSMGIFVSDEVKGDFGKGKDGYSKFLRSNFGRLRIVKDAANGIEVDSAYEELSSLYPSYFPEDIINPADRLRTIAENAGMSHKEVFPIEVSEAEIQEVADMVYIGVSEYMNEARLNAAEASQAPHSDTDAPLIESDIESDTTAENKVLTVREMYDQKKQNYRDSLAALEAGKEKSLASFNEAIGKKLDEYNALRNKNTKRANTLLQQIENLRLRRDNVQGDYANRIAKQQVRLENFESKDFSEFENKVLAMRRSDRHQQIVDDAKAQFEAQGFDLDEVLKGAKDLSTFATVDNTPQRVMEKSLGYKAGQILSDITVNKVAQNETEGIKWLNTITDRKNGLIAQLVKQYGIKPRSKESAAAQMYAEGFYVDKYNDIIKYGDIELEKDFPDEKVRENIKALSKDQRIRAFYDDTLKAINESRARNAYPEIQKLANYFLHFRAMEDTFSRLGLPFNPNDIRAKDLPTDLNGVTADLKPGQPYFASAKHREGKRTSFDLLGGLEKYATSAKNQIYHIDDIQTLRAIRNYVADTYGQARGLTNLDALTEEEVQERIKDVYGAHLSTFAKFLNEEANVLAGKTALIDRGLEGIIGRRAMTFMDSVNRQVGSNMVGYNISSALTNLIAPVQAFAKTNKADFIKGFAQTVSNKVGGIFGKGDGFTDESPVVIRRKGADRYSRTAWQKLSDPGYALMGAVDNFSTELIARAKYNELTRKGMDSETAHVETDKWVSRLMGDRSIGQMPQLYNSKMLGLVTKFQLEVRNQLDSQFYDTIKEANASTEDIQNGLHRNAKKAAKITSTFFTLAVGQHLFGKAFESIAGYNPAFDIINVIIKAFGFDDDEKSEDTVLDNIEQGFFELMGDMPYTSILEGGRIPISSALPIEELYKGKDQYGNEKSRWETVLEALPYYTMPGGYGQLKKTTQGLGMFDEEHPISGSYTDSGKLRFPVEDNFLNRVQAGIFGQYASPNARDYFDNERKALDGKQIQEFIDSGISIQDYWNYREGLSGLKTLNEKADYINSLDLPIEVKNLLINNLSGREDPIDLSGMDGYTDFNEYDFAQKNPEKYEWLKGNGITVEEYEGFDEETKEEYDFAFKYPEKYTMAKSVGGYRSYRTYASDLYDIKADKDEDGKSISGSRKNKVIDYISNLDIEYGEKIILFKSEYPADDTYNYEIIDYLNGRADISYEDMVTILKELGFKIGSDGVTVTWD